MLQKYYYLYQNIIIILCRIEKKPRLSSYEIEEKMVKEIIYTIYESYIYYTVYRNNTMY